MFKKIKDAFFPPTPPTDEEIIQERNRKMAEQLKKRGPFGLTNHAHEWYGYTWKEIHADYFGYYHWQGNYFIWREQVYTGEAVSLLEMGQGFAFYFDRHIRKPTLNYPTPEETAFIDHTKTLWETAAPTFRPMTKQQAIEIFFGHCLGPDTPRMQEEYYNISCPFEMTYLFHTNRAKCTSLEDARRLDQAYYEVFKATMAKKFIRNDGDALKVNAEKTGEADFLRYMDHPYTPVLDGTLDAVIPLPGVEEDLTLPDKAFTDAKEELIILNDLLAGDYTVLRKYLGIKGTRLTDYEVGTKAYAVGGELDVYAKFVNRVGFAAYVCARGDAETAPTQHQLLDGVLFCVPRILNDIKAIYDTSSSDYDWEYACDKVLQSYEQKTKSYEKNTSSLHKEMEKNSDWLKDRRDEAARIFEQFAHATGVKRGAPVEAAIEPVEVIEPVTVKTQQKEIVEAPAPSSAMTQPFIKKPREKLPPVAASGEMTVAHAREVFDYSKDEVVIELELTRRYRNLTRKNYSDEAQDEIDMAYKVLLKIAS